MSDDDEPRRRRRTRAAGATDAQAGGLRTRVKTARGRKYSSKLWLERQLNDPYVRRAQERGYRSRAAFKLLEIDEKFDVFANVRRVADLGAAPGGWTQVALEKGVQDVVGVDILPMDAIAGATLLEGDFTEAAVVEAVKTALAGRPQLVLSDLAANTTGHKQTDHLRTVALVEAAADFAIETLTGGGAFVSKVFQGGATGDVLERLKDAFATVRHYKPPASRAESPETYLVARGFQGG